MPSEAPPRDASVHDALGRALAHSRDAFGSTVVSSLEELRGMLSDAASTGEERAAVLAAELGPFAAGRIDALRLAGLLAGGETLDPAAIRTIRRAASVLEDLVGSELPVRVSVPPGGDLRDAVREALEGAGAAFGAGRVAGLARAGGYREEEHAELLDGLPFRMWTGRERRVAPPLVVRVRGSDLHAAGLGDFMDGGVKIALLVEGPAPAAPLARLITPGALVAQVTSPEGLAALGGFAGPAVAAFFDSPDRVVPFVHDPRKGGLPWERIVLGDEPEHVRALLDDRRPRGRGWKEDVEHLLALATPPAAAAPAASNGGSEAAEPVTGADRLASWLLSHTRLDGA